MDMSMSMPMSSMATSASLASSKVMSMAPSTAAAAMSAATGMSMAGSGSHGMNMGEGNGCKISMLWNWYTIDACFLTPGWRITSAGAFAGSMIGVICLVILLEGLRRAGKDYDRHVIDSYRKKASLSLDRAGSGESSATTTGNSTASGRSGMGKNLLKSPSGPATFRPSLVQQSIRALLHMLQFAIAYIIMLLAMYYNGYLIICIFIGAYLGFFIFGWESVTVDISPPEEATVCCG